MTKPMIAHDILKMIADVATDDAAQLNLINAHVWCFVNGWKFIETYPIQFKGPEHNYLGLVVEKGDLPEHYRLDQAPRYCQSRDALKAIRPEGWKLILLRKDGPFYEATLWRKGVYGCMYFDGASEELAELHAIIQAIEHERKTT